MASARTTIKRDGRAVVLVYVDELGERRERCFYTCRSDGTGYVYEGDHKQVCEGLYSTGRTLECGGNLPALIRREWKRSRVAERAAARGVRA